MKRTRLASCSRASSDGGRVEVVELGELQRDRELVAAVTELVGNREGDTRLDRSHALVEIVHVEVEELALRDLRLLDAGHIAREIGHHPHDEGQLDLLLRVVGILIGEVDPRRPVAANELLT
jgi:hypothetical protein